LKQNKSKISKNIFEVKKNKYKALNKHLVGCNVICILKNASNFFSVLKIFFNWLTKFYKASQTK
jgi:hypothetical protein